jgi:MATE family multidrug resistance protein
VRPDLGRELQALVNLAWPVVLSRAGLLAMTTVDTVMTGWAGGDQLAFLAIGLAPFVLLLLIGSGVLTGTAVLVAQAHGAGEAAATGRTWQHALLTALVAGLLAAALLGGTEAFLLATGQAPEIAAGGARVAFLLGLGMPAMLGFVATSLFLEGLGRPGVSAVVIVLGNLLNVPLNQLLIHGGFGLPAMGAAGAVLATTVVRWAMLAAILGYVLTTPGLVACGTRYRFRPSAAIQRRLLGLGVPFAISQGLETSAFHGLTLLCGWLGPTALGAYHITLNVMALAFMATVGLATATAIRVGQGIGSGDSRLAAAAAWLGLGATLTVMLALAPFVAMGAPLIARLYTSDLVVQELAVRCLWWAAMVIVLDGAQGVLTGGLRGAADVWRPMQIHVASFWLVLLPAGWLLAFPAGLGVTGLLGGMLAGLVVTAGLLAWRLLTLPRQKLRRF